MSNDKKFHWFPFYYQAWMTDMNVQMLSHSEKGLYIDMLCSCFNEDGLPTDHKTLKRLFKCDDDDLQMVVTLFHERDGKLHNKKLDEIKAEQAEVSKKKSMAGKASAQARKAKRLAEATPVEQPLNCVATKPQQNPTSREEESRGENNTDNTIASDDVDRVWSAYPSKTGKKTAIPHVKRALKTYTADELIAKIEAYDKNCKACGRNYLNGSTYFNQDRYEDVLIDPQPLFPQPKTISQKRGY
jgi:uncharacterized protein YdaU (DUF1376 family)